jgi:hypothetical protein
MLQDICRQQHDLLYGSNPNKQRTNMLAGMLRPKTQVPVLLDLKMW